MELDKKIEDYLRPLFGDMAPIALTTQKEKLSLNEEKMSKESYFVVAENIKNMCTEMAGDLIADKIHSGLLDIINEQFE